MSQVSVHVSAATERLLLLLGWERLMKTKPRFQQNETDKAYKSTARPAPEKQRAKSGGGGDGGSASASSWERNRPKLRMPHVNSTNRTAATPATNSTWSSTSWTLDAFDVGQSTGTV